MKALLDSIKNSRKFIRLHKVWNHPVYQEQFWKLQEAERTREFCKHTLSHFLDVARIAQILNLENQYAIPEELLYTTALMHDIGRYCQLIKGIPHNEAGVSLCAQILPVCGFTEEETIRIQEAILSHRKDGSDLCDPLGWCIFCADKLSRNCFACPAANSCNWSEEKRNLQIFI